MDLKEALGLLDTMEDEHWTGNGDVRLDVLKEMLGRNVSRQEVLDVAPQFSRSNPVIEVPDPDQPKEEGNAEEEGLREGSEEVTGVLEEFTSMDRPPTKAEIDDMIGRASDDELTILMDMMDDQLAGLQETADKAKDLYSQVKKVRAYVKVATKERIQDVSNMEAIQEYIKASNVARGGRHAEAMKIQEMVGKDLSKLDPRSMIDRAMARKNTRGANRPNRPLMGG